MPLRKPKFIFFDLGKVLIHFDHERAVRQLAKLSDTSEHEVRRILFESSLQAEYERGQVSTVQFCDSFRQATGCSASNESLCRAASDIFWLNVSIMPLVTALRRANQPIGILSNTCDAHWQFLLNKYSLLSELFPKRILSFEEKSSKPEATIFERAAILAGCQPDELFFVDDLPENVQGAIDAGLDAVLFQSTLDLERQLRDRALAF